MEVKENIVVEMSVSFSLDVIKYTKKLEAEKNFINAKQLLRTDISVGANIHEAQHAESKVDFNYEMKLATKEVNQTMYWLTLCSRPESYSPIELLNKKTNSLFKVPSKIIASTVNILKNSKHN
jgi:four helix bundle protein